VTITSSATTVVTGAVGASGLPAARMLIYADYAEYPLMFLDSTLKAYVVPPISPVDV